MTNSKLKYPYNPSEQAKRFHENLAAIRVLIWGWKSGKTYAGAIDYIDEALRVPNKLGWHVGPTYLHVDTQELELERILYHESMTGILVGRNRNKREWFLSNGTRLVGRSADWPDNLRGPNVDFGWVDEGAYMKDEAWFIYIGRFAATEGPTIITTTPNDHNFLWIEALEAGIPTTMPYGEWGDKDLNVWVSHWPTWEFDWVSDKFLEKKRRTMPKELFDRDYGAMFLTSSRTVFRYVDEAMSRVPFRIIKKKPTVLGLDLAKYQDFTATIIGDSKGRVFDIDRWNKIDWSLQKVRIIEKAKRFNSIIVMDRSNVGSVIEEDLREAGMDVHPVDMNAPQVKRDLIEALQIAFESRNMHIPDPKAHWASSISQELVNELKSYYGFLTPGGRLGYSAPKGQHDDLVVSLALYNWGRLRGFAGGGLKAEDVVIGRQDYEIHMRKQKIRQRRPEIFKKIFGRQGSVGFGSSGGPFWR